MRVEVLVDGRLVELPPRRAEIMVQLLEAEPELDTMEVGVIEFRYAGDKVSNRMTRSKAGRRVARWVEWVRAGGAWRGVG